MYTYVICISIPCNRLLFSLHLNFSISKCVSFPRPFSHNFSLMIMVGFLKSFLDTAKILVRYINDSSLPTPSQNVLKTILQLANITPSASASSHLILSSLTKFGTGKPTELVFNGQIPLNDINNALKDKLLNFGIPNSIYSEQVRLLGEHTLKFSPVLFRAVNNPEISQHHDTTYFSDVTRWELPSKVVSELESLGISAPTIEHIIGINFIQDPVTTLNSLLDSMDSRDDKAGILGSLGDVLTPIERIKPVIDLNPEYLYYQGNEFTLPPIRDDSPVVKNLLTPLGVMGRKNPLMRNRRLKSHLELMTGYGNNLYRILVRSSILKHSNGEHAELYYLLTKEEYLQHLIEASHVFDKLLVNEQLIPAIISNNTKDLYYTQFGQYFGTLGFVDIDNVIQWTETHVKNYIDILDSMAEADINEFYKEFRIFLQMNPTCIDEFRGRKMEKELQFFFLELPKVQTSIPDEFLLKLARHCVSYHNQVAGLTDNYMTSAKMQVMILEKLEPYLLDLGSLLAQDEAKGVKFIKDLVFRLLGKTPYRIADDIQDVNYRMKVKKPNWFNDDKADSFANLASVNYHTSRSYLRQFFNKKEISKFTDLLKNLSVVGQSFWTYTVTIWMIQKGVPHEFHQQINKHLTLKSFKTEAYETFKLIPKSNRGYKQQADKRVANRYLKLKYGQAGFQQMIGLLVVIGKQDILHHWITECVNQIAKDQPLPTLFGDELFHGIRQLEVNDYEQLEEKFETNLESFYRQL